jgi:hypothetical protein
MIFAYLETSRIVFEMTFAVFSNEILAKNAASAIAGAKQ